jgi:hypothetical protein
VADLTATIDSRTASVNASAAARLARSPARVAVDRGAGT